MVGLGLADRVCSEEVEHWILLLVELRDLGPAKKFLGFIVVFKSELMHPAFISRHPRRRKGLVPRVESY